MSEKVRAILESHPIPGVFSKDLRPLWLCMVPAIMASIANGFDYSMVNGLQNIPYFYENTSQNVTQAFPELSADATGAVYFGTLVNMWGFSGFLTMILIPFGLDKLGRRGALIAGGLTIILSSIISGSANAFAQLCVGRFFTGIGVGIACTAAPAYIAEMSHPSHRGVMVGVYNCWWTVGSFLCEGVIRGTITIQNNWSWRVPLLAQIVPATIMVLGAYWLPESPRWLLINGRTAEAKACLVKFHGKGDENDLLVAAEIEEIQEAVNEERETTSGFWSLFNFKPLFDSPSSRYRLLCLVILQGFLAFNGGSLGSFSVKFNELAGFTDPLLLQDMTWIGSAWGVVTSLAGSTFVDKLGRRTMLLYFLVLWYFFLTLSATALTLVTSNDDQWSGRRGTAILYVCLGYFGSTAWTFFFTPLQALYPVEFFNSTQRGRGLALGNLISNVCNIINNYLIPIAVTTIGSHIYWVYVTWGIVTISVVYFFMPETKGRSLEELEEIYSSKNPVKTSLSKISKLEIGEVNEKTA
ncbi:hypothetical protein HDU83_000434 [Entophlyctis luteolus]|nr:hypothetical protein HDU83_000434 [Entophlyctis luteolus]